MSNEKEAIHGPSVISKKRINETLQLELDNLHIMDDARRKAIDTSKKEIIKLEGELNASDYTRRMLLSLKEQVNKK